MGHHGYPLRLPAPLELRPIQRAHACRRGLRRGAPRPPPRRRRRRPSRGPRGDINESLGLTFTAASGQPQRPCRHRRVCRHPQPPGARDDRDPPSRRRLLRRPRSRRSFMADLTTAIRATAEAAREQSLAQVDADVAAVVAQIRTGSKDGEGALRLRSDEDIAGIKEWSRAEIARIKVQAEHRIDARKIALGEELAGHAAAIDERVGEVKSAASAYHAAMATYAAHLEDEDDPARLATMAESMPEPPALNSWADLDSMIFWPIVAEVDVGEASTRVVEEVEAVAETTLEAETTTEPEAAWVGARGNRLGAGRRRRRRRRRRGRGRRRGARRGCPGGRRGRDRRGPGRDGRAPGARRRPHGARPRPPRTPPSPRPRSRPSTRPTPRTARATTSRAGPPARPPMASRRAMARPTRPVPRSTAARSWPPSRLPPRPSSPPRPPPNSADQAEAAADVAETAAEILKGRMDTDEEIDPEAAAALSGWAPAGSRSPTRTASRPCCRTTPRAMPTASRARPRSSCGPRRSQHRQLQAPPRPPHGGHRRGRRVRAGQRVRVQRHPPARRLVPRHHPDHARLRGPRDQQRRWRRAGLRP